MAVIRDTLLLGPSEVTILNTRYPNCQLVMMTKSGDSIQQYDLLLHGEGEEDYYNFLLDNCIAMSSTNFYNRVKRDRTFADRMKARIAGDV